MHLPYLFFTFWVYQHAGTLLVLGMTQGGAWKPSCTAPRTHVFEECEMEFNYPVLTHYMCQEEPFHCASESFALSFRIMFFYILVVLGN